MKRLLALIAVTIAPALASAKETPPLEEAFDQWLASRMGVEERTASELQKDVEKIGGVPFLSNVTVEFMDRKEMAAYFTAVLQDEYPLAEAEADQRMLVAFDLLPEGIDLRRLRARLLEENVVGFYDERPGKKRLFAVSSRSRLTPLNQVILAHELRHALQDQYIDVHNALPRSIGDFDDRRLALLCLLEGDAVWLMERYLASRTPMISDQTLDALWTLDASLGDDVPQVLRDQLVLPYASGRIFARALWNAGGWNALHRSWSSPPQSTEQVFHPEKYATREAPMSVIPPEGPSNGRLLREGVLGEMMIRTLLGGKTHEAASGWGGDVYRVWDVAGHTLLLWRCVWDTALDEQEFEEALIARLTRSHGRERRIGPLRRFTRGNWEIAVMRRHDGLLLAAADDGDTLLRALRDR